MAVFKCKICGGTLEINVGETVATCEYCGTKQTLPKLDDEKKANLFDRANHFRRNNDFDKAMGIYEQILNEDTEDAESYWSIVLCRYGIEYVEDPSSRKRVPTVNRAQFTSVFDDEDYKSAIKYADSYQKNIYEAEAAAINEIQKGILAISQKEEPFDVFICYKETDNNGRRTQDSVLATELYHELTKEGFKVFFARITLEDKLGVAYEPYIFAALHSAKVMVSLGTKPEHFNAVWVKNEWSRYLSLIKNGANKILIPAYRDMDPYDLPEEFSHLQAQDMSKLGFMQDLVRGIKKLVSADASSGVKETVVVQSTTSGNTNVEPLLERAFMFLEDDDWSSADEYAEKVLDIDPKCAEAYLAKLMAELRVRQQDSLKDQVEPFDNRGNFQKVVRFADEKLKTTLNSYINHINTQNENERLSKAYANASQTMKTASNEEQFKSANRLFMEISEYKDSKILAEKCLVKAEIARKKAEERKKRIKKIAIIISAIVTAIIIFVIVLITVIIPNNKYKDAVVLMNEGKYVEAASILETINGYKDSNEKIGECIKVIETKISAGAYHTVGLKADGSVVAVGNNESGQCNVSSWTGIVAVYAGDYHTVGLKADGSVVAVGNNPYGECNVSGWTDIVAVSTGNCHTVGLKADGSVVAVGDNDYGQCNVSRWKGIIAVSAGGNHTVGLKADGSVVAVGWKFNGQCNVTEWNLFE